MDELAEVESVAARTTDLGVVEREEARSRAARVLALAEDAPPGHGLADTAVAAYDEAVSTIGSSSVRRKLERV